MKKEENQKDKLDAIESLKFIKNVLEKSTIINTSILSKISDEYEIHETENKSYCIVVSDNTIALFYPISNKVHLKFTNEWISNGVEWIKINLIKKAKHEKSKS